MAGEMVVMAGGKAPMAWEVAPMAGGMTASVGVVVVAGESLASHLEF